MTRNEAGRLIDGFAEQTRREPSWRALAVVGSWARGTARDDSDLDFLILTDRIGEWSADDAWLRTMVTALGFECTTAALEAYGCRQILAGMARTAGGGGAYARAAQLG